MKLVRYILACFAIVLAVPAAFALYFISGSLITPARPEWVSKAAVPIYDDKTGWRWERCVDTQGGSVRITYGAQADWGPSTYARFFHCGEQPTETLAENAELRTRVESDRAPELSVPGDLTNSDDWTAPCTVIPTQVDLSRFAAVFAMAAASPDLLPREALGLRTISENIESFEAARLLQRGWFCDETGPHVTCRVVEPPPPAPQPPLLGPR